MVIRVCAGCGIPIDARGRRKYCDPCSEENIRRLRREDAARARLIHPEKVLARQKRWRDAHKEELRIKSQVQRQTQHHKDTEGARRDRTRFAGLKGVALHRDQYKCRMCGACADEGFRNLTIHHIDGDKTHNELANLITLCRSCHPRVHNRWQGATRQDELRALIAS